MKKERGIIIINKDDVKLAKRIVSRTFDCSTCKYGKQPNEKHPCNICNEFYDKHISR